MRPGVIGAPDQGAGLHVPEPQPKGLDPERGELLGREIAVDGEVIL